MYNNGMTLVGFRKRCLAVMEEVFSKFKEKTGDKDADHHAHELLLPANNGIIGED